MVALGQAHQVVLANGNDFDGNGHAHAGLVVIQIV